MNSSAMKLKSYFSGTVEAAMELARKELGEEALLVNARPATPETRYLGAYEVVFGMTSPEINVRSTQASRSDQGAVPAVPSPNAASLVQEVAALQREFERVTQSLLEANRDIRASGSALYNRLIAQDLDPSLA